jgi:hypothetical protein
MMRSLPGWIGYVAPVFAFVALTQLETRFGAGAYPFLYALKVVIVAGAALLFARDRAYPELTKEWRYLPLALVLGIVLCAAWIAIDRVTPHFDFLGSRSGFNPWRQIDNPIELYGFLAVRFAGFVIVSPVIEELFYRSFLLRFAIDPGGFKSVDIGKFDPISCGFAVVVMAAGHPEWLAAAVFSLAMNILVYRTKSVFACIATHAATNLALGVYILYAHAWTYW